MRKIGIFGMSKNSFLLLPLLTCCVVNCALSDRKLPLKKRVCAYSFCVEWNSFFFYLLCLLAVLWTGTLLGCKLPVNEQVCACSRLFFFCDEWKFFPFTSFTHLLCCELVHSQPSCPVSCHSMNMFVHTHFVLSEIHSLFYLLCPLAVLWTGALSARKLPLNEHVCACSRLDFLWWVKIHSFFLPSLLAVLWTGTLSAPGKVPLNEHVCAYSFCVEWNLFFYLLYPLTVLWNGTLSASKLALNEHVCAYSWLDIVFVWWGRIHSFFCLLYSLCCELVHSQKVSYLWMNMFVHTHFVLSEICSFFTHLLCFELVHS